MIIKRTRKLNPNLIKKAVYVLLLIVAFLIGAISRGFFPVAMVDGNIISTNQLNQSLKKTSGKQVLNLLIAQKLLEEELNDRDVKITNDEVLTEIKTIKKNMNIDDRQFNQILKEQGKTLIEYKKEIRLEIAIQKLFKTAYKFIDTDIENYLSANNIQKSPQSAIYESQKIAVENILTKQRIVQQFQAWLNREYNDKRVILFIKV